MPLASCGKSCNRLCRASLGCRLLGAVHLVGRQQHPGNPGIFIREGHGRLVLAATVHEASEPRATAIRLEPEPAQRRACAMDEEGPEVYVPAFTDPKQPWLAARGMLPRHQADPRRKLAPILERAGIADRRDQGRRRQWTNPRDRHEALADRMRCTDRCNL